jgi:hypothetical protein
MTAGRPATQISEQTMNGCANQGEQLKRLTQLPEIYHHNLFGRTVRDDVERKELIEILLSRSQTRLVRAFYAIDSRFRSTCLIN